MRWFAGLMLGALLAGCGDPAGPTHQPFEGTWLWTQSEGGIAGERRTPLTEQASVLLDFRNGLVRAYRNGALVAESRYTATELPANGPLPVYEIVYEPDLPALPFAPLDEHTVQPIAPGVVQFVEPCCDRWVHTFVNAEVN